MYVIRSLHSGCDSYFNLKGHKNNDVSIDCTYLINIPWIHENKINILFIKNDPQHLKSVAEPTQFTTFSVKVKFYADNEMLVCPWLEDHDSKPIIQGWYQTRWLWGSCIALKCPEVYAQIRTENTTMYTSFFSTLAKLVFVRLTCSK